MKRPRQPKEPKVSKSGLKPGQTSNTTDRGGPDRPVAEEDVFGGAERVHVRRVRSNKAKP